MRRRDLLGIASSIALALIFVPVMVVCSFGAWGQQPEPARRIGVLMNASDDDSQGHAQLAAFQQALQTTGWSDGSNVRIDVRWGANNLDLDRRYATELVALAPDVILAAGTLSVSALQHVTHSLPIVFATVSDPVGAGFVDSLARPGGNTTGFMLFEYSLSGKWLQLLKQIAPNVTRAAVLRDSANPAGIAQFGAIQAIAPSLGVQVSPISVGDGGEIERRITGFARSANGGLIVAPSASESERALVIELAARHKLPAVYGVHTDAARGGLMSYAPDYVDQFRRAADYVDRILRGESPANLPVQAPSKYDLVINLKTAHALGLTIAPTLLSTADEVIE